MASIVKKTFRKKRACTVVDLGVKGRSVMKRYAKASSKEVAVVSEVHLSHEVPFESDKPQDAPVVSSYCDRRAAVEKGWEDIRRAMPKSYMESCEPGHKCSRCGDTVEETVVCFDCGPGSEFCGQCCIYLHTYVKFHLPMIWKVCIVEI